MADREIGAADLERMLPMLKTGPLASAINAFMPGAAQKLEALGKDLMQSPDLPSGSSKGGGGSPHISQTRAGNPFPPLKPKQ